MNLEDKKDIAKNTDKYYLLYCQCGWKKITNQLESYYVYKPSANDKNKKIRCCGCGKAIVIKPALDPQSIIDAEKEETKRLEKEAEFQAEKELFVQEYQEITKKHYDRINKFDGCEEGTEGFEV